MQSTMTMTYLLLWTVLIYYTAGIVCAEHLKMLTCSFCGNVSINTADSVKNIESSVLMNRLDARLINAGKLVHPNSAVFNIIKKYSKRKQGKRFDHIWGPLQCHKFKD